MGYLSAVFGRFSLKNVVFVTPGMSGSYVLPFVFSDHPKLKVSGLVTVSPGNLDMFVSSLFNFSDYVDHFTDDQYRNLEIPTLVFYGEYDGEGEINARTLKKIPGKLTHFGW